MDTLPVSIKDILTARGFKIFASEDTGYFFHNKDFTDCIIVDNNICNLTDYHYIDYTTRQNSLINDYDRVFRFLPDIHAPDSLRIELDLFLNGEPDPDVIRRYGGNRAEQNIDPSLPEAEFEECFIEAYGYEKLACLHRELPYVDFEGKTRFVDYGIFAENLKIAVELNGESFHHPCVIGHKRYRSQLFKQNSLVADGFKVFRWSLRGMQDREKFIQEIRAYFGNHSGFRAKSSIKQKRSVDTFELYEHQHNAMTHLDEGRGKGKKTFLIVLPTGTGKTEILIEDILRLKKENNTLKTLIIVPTRKLRSQTIERFKLRAPDLRSSDSIYHDPDYDVWVQTSAYMHRHYFKLESDRFDYLVVDEAHHTAAFGLRKILEHFNPEHLIGLTATPDRADGQKLEDIFGEYESMLTLEEAVKTGIAPPIRCFRIKSNIDLSQVRFNGREYVKADLQTTVIIPSRDELIAKTLRKYFAGSLQKKQGVVFCVDIKHAERMAHTLRSFGISAEAVSGNDVRGSRERLKAYESGDIRFLCACDILTEGWDAPHTSIIVMARPTFSRVLYTQQIGRGTRHHQNKEALYVLDVVDNYGASLQPLSLHSLFGIGNYRPFDNIIQSEYATASGEVEILDGLYEEERRIEPVNIFNYEDLYGTYLNEEQLARELFVSTGTIRAWVKRQEITSDVQHQFGRRQLHFFAPEKVAEIRTQKGLKNHSEETRKNDFIKFLEKRDYTFSFKIIFLLSFFKVKNNRGEASLSELTKHYKKFYELLHEKHGRNEKNNCPLNRLAELNDSGKVQASLLRNPFEKFERKRFFYHCKDLNYIAMDVVLYSKLSENDYVNIKNQMIEDMRSYYGNMDISIKEEDYACLLPQAAHAQPATLKIEMLETPPQVKAFKSFLPFYPLDIAAGSLVHSETMYTPSSWIDISELSSRKSFNNTMFVSQVQGHSMYPAIKDGDYCIFKLYEGGTRNGQIVLAQKLGMEDVDTGANYTVKRYESIKASDPETDWRHERIMLKADNPEYADIEIKPDYAGDFKIVAILLEILKIDR